MIFEKFYRKLIKGGIKNKIKMASIFLLLFNLIIIGVISYLISSASIMDRIGVTNVEIINQSMGGIDFILKSIENSAIQAFESLDLAKQLDKARHGSKEEKQEVDAAINDVIKKLLYIRNEIDYIYIIGENYIPGRQEGIYSNETYARLQVINENEFRNIFEKQGDKYFWTYVVKEGLDVLPLKKIGLCRAILDERGNYKGFILIMLREGTLADIYYNLSQDDRQIYLVDQEGLVVSSTDRNLVGKMFPEKLKLEEINATAIKAIDNRKYIVSSTMSQYTGWKLYTVGPLQTAVAPLATIRWWTIVAILASLLIFLVLSIFLSNVLTKPIIKLKNKALSYQNHEYDNDNAYFQTDSGPEGAIRRHKRINFRTKLFIMLFTIIIIPEILLMTVSYFISYDIVERKYADINRLNTSQVRIKLEHYLSSFEKSIYDLYAENGLNSILRQAALSDESFIISDDNLKVLNKVLVNMSDKNRDIIYTQLFDANKKFIAYYGTHIQNVNESIFEEVDSSSETKNIWYGPYSNYFKQNVFTLGKKIRDMNDFITLGYMFVTLKETDFEGVYRNPGETWDLTYIVDSNGLIVSHPNKNLLNTRVDRELMELLKGNMEQAIITGADNERKTVSFDEIRNTGWKVVHISSMASVSRSMQQMLAYFIAVLFLTGISVAYITSRVSRSIVKPLNDLNRIVNGFVNGETVMEDLKFATGDEIEQLSESFHNMMFRIHSLIKEVYEARLKRNEAELNSKNAELTLLQAQINPHFLYNTLEIIRWKAMFLTGGENEVTEIVSALSDFFRLSLSKGEKTIPLKDEIAHARNYIIIMNYRYTNKIDVHWHVEEELLDRRVPKLILQPVVENAIYHGIKPREGQGRIDVYVQRNENRIELIVRDNGVGMSSEAVEKLNGEIMNSASSQSQTGEKGGYGLRNVNQRIKLTFGDDYGLFVSSEQGIGTSVHICLPLTEK